MHSGRNHLNKHSPYGTLFIVSTPIGNLEDMTFRAVSTLKQVDLIAAEDTRHSKKLLSHYSITTQMVSFHEHNEKEKTASLIDRLKNGQDLALISDAGTPCISDPGYTLVHAASNAHIKVVPIPGCCAAIAGLSASGLPTDKFLFLGFLPKKKQALEKSLSALKDETATLIIYESPKRIKKTLESVRCILGDRHACLVREVTKLHEEIIQGTVDDILSCLLQRNPIKGEIVLMIKGAKNKQAPDMERLQKAILRNLKKEKTTTSQLSRTLADEFSISRKTVYDLILTLKKEK
jgi:16S rRNA (cytidine1402-2'-O)-methyltransferase